MAVKTRPMGRFEHRNRVQSGLLQVKGCALLRAVIQLHFGRKREMRSRNGSLLRNAAYFGLGLACTAAGRMTRGAIGYSNWARGKVVVITGGSRGLGLALAEEFGRRGAQLVLAARNETDLSNARRQLLDQGAIRNIDDVLIVAVDLRKEEDAARLIDEATRRFGRVDVLINNAECLCGETIGSSGRTRTYNPSVNSRMLCH